MTSYDIADIYHESDASVSMSSLLVCGGASALGAFVTRRGAVGILCRTETCVRCPTSPGVTVIGIASLVTLRT